MYDIAETRTLHIHILRASNDTTLFSQFEVSFFVLQQTFILHAFHY